MFPQTDVPFTLEQETLLYLTEKDRVGAKRVSARWHFVLSLPPPGSLYLPVIPCLKSVGEVVMTLKNPCHGTLSFDVLPLEDGWFKIFISLLQDDVFSGVCVMEAPSEDEEDEEKGHYHILCGDEKLVGRDPYLRLLKENLFVIGNLPFVVSTRDARILGKYNDFGSRSYGLIDVDNNYIYTFNKDKISLYAHGLPCKVMANWEICLSHLLHRKLLHINGVAVSRTTGLIYVSVDDMLVCVLRNDSVRSPNFKLLRKFTIHGFNNKDGYDKGIRMAISETKDLLFLSSMTRIVAYTRQGDFRGVLWETSLDVILEIRCVDDVLWVMTDKKFVKFKL